jgi:hypothetical protein
MSVQGLGGWSQRKFLRKLALAGVVVASSMSSKRASYPSQVSQHTPTDHHRGIHVGLDTRGGIVAGNAIEGPA